MKITFSTIKSGEIFCDDFLCLTDLNGTIEFKHMQTAGGIAVVYAPNGTGKSSLASLLDTEVTDESRKFVAADEYGNEIKPETGTFHVIHDQLNRNVIRGKTTDYLIGAQIRREYELRDRLSVAYQNAFSQLSSKYKTDKALLGTDPKDMELSRGEQNFISLTFEFLLARHSDKEYVILDDPISSLDSVYKNKIAFCIIKFLENKKQLVLTHNTDLIRLLDVQLNNCFNLYIMNNILDGTNGFISVSEKEKKLLINLHDLVSFFQNKNNELVDNIHNRRHFLMAMVPFMRGYAHISLDSDDRYGQLSGIMHGYGTNNSLDVLSVYNSLFGNIFDGEEIISVSDILEVDYSALDILDKTQYPLLSDTLEQTLIYYHLRMKVEKELVDVFHLRTDDMMMLNQIIQKAFRCNENDPNFERMREYRVFFTSRKTLLNEFNHFEGNMNIFQPAIDISKESLKKEMEAIRNKLEEIRAFVSSQENA